MTDYYDPRENLSHDPEIGQVYIDSRYEDSDAADTEYLTIIYMDRECVILRSNEKLDRGVDMHRHRIYGRKEFEKLAGADRLKWQPDTDSPIEGGRLGRIEDLAEEWGSKDGRKSQHYAEAFQMAIDVFTGQESPDSDEPVAFSDLSHVGDKTAANLKAAGYVTKGDVRHAPDEELRSVHGVGKKALDSIKEAVR
jgi:hypothetical protein